MKYELYDFTFVSLKKKKKRKKIEHFISSRLFAKFVISTLLSKWFPIETFCLVEEKIDSNATPTPYESTLTLVIKINHSKMKNNWIWRRNILKWKFENEDKHRHNPEMIHYLFTRTIYAHLNHSWNITISHSQVLKFPRIFRDIFAKQKCQML